MTEEIVDNDDTIIQGYLVSEITSLTVVSNHSYRVNEGTVLCLKQNIDTDDFWVPEERNITVLMSGGKFQRNDKDQFDDKLSTDIIKEKVKEVMTDGVLNDVQVSVLVEESSPVEEEKTNTVVDVVIQPNHSSLSWLCCIPTRGNNTQERRQSYGRLRQSSVSTVDKDIQLKISVSETIKEKEQEITSSLSDYLTTLGYKSTIVPLFTPLGKLMSKHSVDLLVLNPKKVHIPNKTRFHFHKSHGCPLLLEIFEPHAKLNCCEEHNAIYTVPQHGIIMNIVSTITAIIYYYFPTATIQPQNPLTPQSIHTYILTVYQSIFLPQDIIVHTVTFNSPSSESSSGQFSLIGFNVEITNADSVTPTEVQRKLQDYFDNNMPPGPLPIKVLPPPFDKITSVHQI